MKISTKGRYALRLMIDIAIHSAAEPVRIKDIAKRQDVSEKYLEQIIAVLNKAGYVKSIRGPKGGYLLTKQPAEYTAGKMTVRVRISVPHWNCGNGWIRQSRTLWIL